MLICCICYSVRWTPSLQDAPLFCDQSAALYCFYYYTRILIHRPLIPVVLSASALPPSVSEPDLMQSLRSPSIRSFVHSLQAMLALGICASAARACITVASTQLDRRPDAPLSLSQVQLFIRHTVPRDVALTADFPDTCFYGCYAAIPQ